MAELSSCEELLQAMVGFDTVNARISGRPDAERALSLFMDEQARKLGFETARLPVSESGFNLLVTHQISADAPWVMFESHLDTVSVEGMTIDPFGGRIESGRIYGRGACDTKSSGAAMLWALNRYAAEGSAGNNVAIAYTLDEEIGKTGARALAEQHFDDLSWRPAGIIVGEPTGLRPVVAHNGVMRWTIHTRGVAAHSADPSRGRSAISMMVKVIDAIESRYVPQLSASHPLTGRAACSINIIRGGVQINIIPESCEIEIDRRLVPGEDAREVLPAVEALLDELRGRDSTLSVSQGEPFIDPALDPAGHETFIAFVCCVIDEMALPSEPLGVAYATDASNYSHVGIPAVVLGPGDIAQAHTKDEWLELSQLHGAVDVYLNLMRHPMETAR